MTNEATAHDAAPQPADTPGEAHGAADHGDDGGHDDHGHAEVALGPIDTAAWGAFILGSGLGIAVALTIALSTG